MAAMRLGRYLNCCSEREPIIFPFIFKWLGKFGKAESLRVRSLARSNERGILITTLLACLPREERAG